MFVVELCEPRCQLLQSKKETIINASNVDVVIYFGRKIRAAKEEVPKG